MFSVGKHTIASLPSYLEVQLYFQWVMGTVHRFTQYIGSLFRVDVPVPMIHIANHFLNESDGVTVTKKGSVP